MADTYHGANVGGVKYFLTDNDGVAIPDLTIKGVMVEPEAENLCLQSEDFSTSWALGGGGAILSNQTTSPDYLQSADKFNETAVTDEFSINQTITVFDGYVTFSIFTKADERSRICIRENTTTEDTVAFNLTLGTILNETGATATIEALGNDWFRCSMTHEQLAGSYQYGVFLLPDDGSSYSDIEYLGVVSEGLYIWGAQLEQSSFPSSYIPTTDSAITRSKDELSYNIENVIEQGTGSIYCEFEYSGNDAIAYPFSLSDGTTANIIASSLTTAKILNSSITDSSTTTVSIDSTNEVEKNINQRPMITYEMNNAAAYLNGENLGEDTTATIPTTLTTLYVGNSIGDNQLGGNVKNINYYKTVLTEAKAARITDSVYNQDENGSIIFDENGSPIIKS